MKFFRGLIVFLCGILVGGIIIKFSPGNITNIISSVSIKDNSLGYYQNKYERFELVDAILQDDYYYPENINSGLMIQEAVKAYVDAIDDPYTVYMDSEENSGFMNELEGEDHFEGIGAVVSKKDYYVLIEEVIKNAPAYKAGIKPLDRIIKIDDDYIQDWTLDEAVKHMRGPAGTKVEITLERDSGDDTEVLKIEVIRDTVDIPSVTSEILNVGEKKIGYVEISTIGEETEKLFKLSIKELLDEGIDGIILDLRGNGGGYLDVGVEIASHFIPKGQLVVSAKYRGYSDTNYYSEGYGDLEGMKTVVLVDGLTASAGEIIALALQEQVGATLLGTTTFGKGSIQTIYPFQDGDSIKYTVGARYPPSDISVNEIGAAPDIVVEFDAEAYINDDIDNQLEEAKNLFN